jgi:probable HAF family extracellular repeat protein
MQRPKFRPRLEVLETRTLMTMGARIIDLGTLGGDVSVPYALNEKGQVAGFSNISKNGPNHAFIWDLENGMRDLGVLPGGTQSGAYGINELGQVVGVSTSSKGTRAFVWDEVNGMQDLGSPWGDFGRCNAWDINDLGQIVGSCIGPDDFEPEHSVAVIWQGGNELSLIPNQWGTPYSYAYGINNNGEIVGWATAQNGEPHAYFYEGGIEGKMINLGTLGGPNSKAYRMNNQRQIVGAASSGGRYDKAFYWNDGAMANIPTLGGAFNYAYGINDAGWVVGKSFTSPPNIHAYLFKDNQLINLNIFIEEASTSGWRALTEAKDINNQNQIVGWGRRWKEKHGYIMNLKVMEEPPAAIGTAFRPSFASTADVTPTQDAPAQNPSVSTVVHPFVATIATTATDVQSVPSPRAIIATARLAARSISEVTFVLKLDVFA